MPIPIALGILAATAASAVGSALTNRRAEVVAKRNAEQQRQWQLEDREHQEQYNDPVNQMARMRAAGINPMAAAGTVSPGESAVPEQTPIDSVQYRNPGEDIASGINSLANYSAEQQNIKIRQKQNELAEEQLRQNKDRLEMDKLNSESQRWLNEKIGNFHEKEGYKIDEEIGVIQEQFKRSIIENSYLDDQLKIDLEKRGIELDTAKLDKKLYEDTYEERKKSYEFANKQAQAQIDELVTRCGVNKATAAKLSAETRYIFEELCEGIPHLQAEGLRKSNAKADVSKAIADKQLELVKVTYETLKNDAKFKDSTGYRVWNEVKSIVTELVKIA